MGHVSSIVKNQSSANKSGLWWQDEKLPDGETWLGKYQGCTHDSDGSYVRVWYEGDKFLPEKTYTDEYCKKNKLGKYAKESEQESGDSGKKDKQKSSDSGKDEGYAIKFLFTIIPLLPIWWVIKLPFKFIYAKCMGLLNAIFCGCCCEAPDSCLPKYSFLKF